LNVAVDDVDVEVGAEVRAGLGDDAGEEVDGVDEEGGIPTIFEYLNQIEPGDDVLFCDALNFSKKYVGTRIIDSDEEDSVNDTDSDDEFSLNGRGELIIESDVQAKGAIHKLSAAAKKRLLALLVEHVNQEHRKNPTAKDLIGWIQQPNVVRNYWFYKAAGLKALISARGMTLTPGRKSIEEMREILDGVRNDS